MEEIIKILLEYKNKNINKIDIHRTNSETCKNDNHFNKDQTSDSISLFGHSDWITSLIYISQDLFASASADKTIKIFDLKGDCLRILIGLNQCINSLLSLDKNKIASAS